MPFRIDRDTGVVPAIHGLHLAELVARWGVPEDQFLRAAGLCKTALSQPHSRLTVAMLDRLVESARALTGEPALGIYFGLQMRVSWHGYVGLAAMTAQNTGQALELITRFAPTLTDALALSIEKEGSGASLFFREHADFGAGRDAIILALMIGIWQLACSQTGRQVLCNAEVAMPEPAYYARVRSLIPGTIRFGQAENRLIIAEELLELPLVAADPAALLLIREQCERELDALGSAGPFRERVRALALRGSGGTRSLEEVANQMHLASRTLKRRLAEFETSYSDLLDEERHRRSLLFLRETSLSLQEIAERLGYSDTPNFFRAFRRWTGRTPNSVRQANLRRRQHAPHSQRPK